MDIVHLAIGTEEVEVHCADGEHTWLQMLMARAVSSSTVQSSALPNTPKAPTTNAVMHQKETLLSMMLAHMRRRSSAVQATKSAM